MIALDRPLAARHDEFDAGDGLGAVADDITEAVDIADLLLVDVRQDGLEGLYVAMKITDDGDATM